MNNTKYIPTLSTYNLPLEQGDEVEFSFQGVCAATVMSGNTSAKPILQIKIQEKIELLDSAHESSRYSRPKLLVVLGILSFVSGKDFSVYEINSSSSSKIPGENIDVIGFKCFFNSIDYCKVIKAICSIIDAETNTKDTLFFSLLDRWRKAQHQLIESEGQGLLEDESLLSFFHVLELLVTEYQDKQKNEAQEKISLFLTDLLKNTYKYRGPSLDGKINEKKKILKDILLSGDLLSVGNRINYMFEQQGLLNAQVQYLLQELISARNSIAHGRHVFRDKLIWPLPPFFMLHTNHFNLGVFIRVLTARSISAHYALNLWLDEWGDILENLSPPIDIIRKFLIDKIYEKLSARRFCDGVAYAVTPASIIDAYIKGKIKFSDIENSLGKHIKTIDALENEKQCVGEALFLFIILADSANIKLAEFCKKNIQSIYDNRTFAMSNIKDYLRFLEYYNVKLNWFREWIVGGMKASINADPGARTSS